jgi:hypothetical protein
MIWKPPPPPFPRVLPPVRQGSDPAFAAAGAPAAQQAPPGTAEPQVINSIQEQLQQTQSLLSTHVEKMHNLDLETIAGEHDGMKREIGMLRDLIDQRQRELELKRQLQMQKAIDDDDDDAKSVATVTAGEHYHEDEDEENDDERRQRREELGRPRTPEPSLGDGDSDGEGDIGVRTINIRNRGGTIRGGSWNGDSPGPTGASQHRPNLVSASSRESVDTLNERLEQLMVQCASAMEFSKSLQTQQQAAQEQIALLQAKVVELESAKEQWAAASAQREENEEMKEAGVAAALLELGKTYEGKWERQKEEWEEERLRLNEARLQWEQRMREVEEDVNGAKEVAAEAKTAAADASSVARAAEKTVAALSTQLSTPPANGVAHKAHQQDLEFQAPPSPRSLSSDSTRARRKRPSSLTRSRSTSRSPRPKPLANGHAHLESEGQIALIDSSPTTSKFIPGVLSGPTDGRSPLSPKNGPRLQVRPKSPTEDMDAATPVPSSTSPPLSRKSDLVSFRFLPRPPHTPPRTAPVTYPITPETHDSTSGTPSLQLYFPSRTQRQQQYELEREHNDSDTTRASSRPQSSFTPATHSELHPSTHWLIILFSLSFLLPQPVPYFSAIASASILVGIAAYVITYQIHE